MRIQLLSDLHLETEPFEPEPAPGAEMLLLAGDIDSTWEGLAKFRGWPVPVLFIAGNHEFDGRELKIAWPALKDRCDTLGLQLLERGSVVRRDSCGRHIRFVATVRWSDFNAFGEARRDKAMRAAGYFMRLMNATHDGHRFDAQAVRAEALSCRAWLAGALALQAPEQCDATVAITHFAPSLRSADPRYGQQAGTASFCNDDEDLLPMAQVWIHGHLHCRHDYRVAHARGETRVVCNARGHTKKGEADGYDGLYVLDV